MAVGVVDAAGRTAVGAVGATGRTAVSAIGGADRSALPTATQNAPWIENQAASSAKVGGQAQPESKMGKPHTAAGSVEAPGVEPDGSGHAAPKFSASVDAAPDFSAPAVAAPGFPGPMDTAPDFSRTGPYGTEGTVVVSDVLTVHMGDEASV